MLSLFLTLFRKVLIQILLPVPSRKDLGVILDNNQTYDDYITKTVSSCFSLLAQINRVKHAFNKKILVNIIYTLEFSKLLCCSNMWANTSNSIMRKLQSCQNYACRIISGAKKYDHISLLLKESNWLALEKLIYLRSATLAFKCITGSAPDYLTSKFTNDLTSVGEKIETHNRYIFPY